MTYQETMGALEAAGSEQTRKIYRRHGAPDPMFGVSFAVLGQLQKKIKQDHALARRLWASNNTDARNLAMMIADPAATTSAELDAWAGDANSGFFAGLLARNLVVKSSFAHDKAMGWIKSGHEGTAVAGWYVICAGADRPELFSDDELLALLPKIEARIHGERNGVREAMNQAVIAIGVRNPKCQKAALAAANRIGKVEVDHGETNCKTPDAAAYIKKTVAHRAKRKGQASKARR